ncbi:MAG: hypothetical protein ACKE8G_01925 [Methylophagaceae bacterium]
MMKQISLATITIFIVWSALGFLVHGILLQPIYEASASLWRSVDEIKMGLGYAVSLISAFGFVLIYTLFITPKSVSTALKFGFIWGIVAGINAGFATYAYMPIPESLAWAWYLDLVVGGVVAGWISGLMIKQ